MSTVSTLSGASRNLLSTSRRPVLYPDQYAWYIFASALDIMVTITVLVHLGAREVNMLAQRSIELFGTWGLIGLKFLSVILVVGICEFVGRRKPRAGQRLATAAILISLVPVFSAIIQAAALGAAGNLEFVTWPHAASE
jgi:uncharacterized membrane protein